MNDPKPTKPTLKQSFADIVASLRVVFAKVSPRLGFIYFSILLAGITGVVFITTQTMQSTDIGQGTEATQKMNEYLIPFDQSTVAKLKALNSEGSSLKVTVPTGRINPFSESVY